MSGTERGETPETVPAVVLGGSGYVAGELLRLLAGHPVLRPAAVISASHAGEAVESVFRHLAGCYPGLAFVAPGELPAVAAAHPRLAAFSAAPHGASAPRVAELLAAVEGAGGEVRVVDLSADFRFSSAAVWEGVYGQPHPAPRLVPRFRCVLPEHATVPDGRTAAPPRGAAWTVAAERAAASPAAAPSSCIAHPGCFTTATLLAAVPLLARGLVEPRIAVVAVTGSTGAGRTPTATTHHPERRSTLFAYKPLAHRHGPEMEALARAASGVAARFDFVPQSGPFARGIYATLSGRLVEPVSSGELAARLADFYRGAPFVRVGDEPPRLQDVVGSNRCHLGVAAREGTVFVFAALDNLVKGAAGGAVQWMNRMLGLPETCGLTQPGPGWL